MFGFPLEDSKNMFESKVTTELLLEKGSFRSKSTFATENRTCHWQLIQKVRHGFTRRYIDK